ncbi:MAG: AsmA-like C-terminal region-containing protein [Opitutaceae bacterium]
MKPKAQFWRELGGTVLSWIGSFVLWSAWLALSLALAAQLYILNSRELALPDFALRQIEAQLAESGLRASFGRAAFDPSGRILIENLRLSLPAFPEPVLAARTVYVRVSPTPLLAGRIEPSELRLSGVTVSVPAMLSPSGRTEELLRDFDATLQPGAKTVAIHQLNGHFANLTITAHGKVVLVPPTEKRTVSETISDFIANRFPLLCRQGMELATHLGELDRPMLHVEFSPSASGAAIIEIRASARRIRVPGPTEIEADEVRVATRVLLFGDTPAAELEVTAAQVRLPAEISVAQLRARILGRFQSPGPAFDLREVNLTASSITAGGVEARALSAQIFPRPLPAIETNAVATIFGVPLGARIDAQLNTRQATVRFRGDLSPEVLTVVSARVGTDVRRFFDYKSLFVEQGEARFGAGFAFERLAARVTLPEANAYGVMLTDARTSVELTPGFFFAPEAFARIGENYALGSYEQDFRTLRYRFLLAGQLKPLEISPWFREWWPNFFRQMEFPARPPEAAVDVAGVWRDGGQSSVFVFADADQPIVRGAPLDRVRTRLFIRPGYIDGLDLLATRGDHQAIGTFTYRADRFTQEWHTLDLDLDSNFDLKTAAQIIGPNGAQVLNPFQLSKPPELKIAGQISGAAAVGGANVRLAIEGRTSGEFRFHGFPLRDVAFRAKLDRDEISLDDITGSFAGGAITGHARVWGPGASRRVGFDLALDNASLGSAVSTLGEFFAARKNEPTPAPGKFLQQKANVRLSVAASAEGGSADAYSYHGAGSAVLRGTEIGEVPLLGALSDLLKFTSLRFTEALGNFKIDGPKLVFPEFKLRGANSAIDAHGTYALDRGQLDFNAKLFPFQESGNILKTVVGAVLSPLSSAFEVKLTGSLAKPEWSLAILRSSGPPAEAETKSEPSAAPAPEPKAGG